MGLFKQPEWVARLSALYTVYSAIAQAYEICLSV